MILPHDTNFLTINDANEWFSHQSTAISMLKEKIVLCIKEQSWNDIPESFSLLSLDEANRKIEFNEIELDLISSFQLISAAEGRLKYDYQLKLNKSSLTPLLKDFKYIYKNKKSEMRYIDIDTDILTIWKKHYPSQNLSNLIGDFKRLMSFRHWIAHGRFWEPNRLGRNIRQFHPDLVTKEIEDLFTHLNALPDGFFWS